MALLLGDSLNRAFVDAGAALRARLLVDLRQTINHRDRLNRAHGHAVLAAGALVPVNNNHSLTSCGDTNRYVAGVPDDTR